MLIDTRDRNYRASVFLAMFGCVVGGVLVGFAVGSLSWVGR